MIRLYGRNLKGLRVKNYVPDARWQSLSLLSRLRSDGSTQAIVYKGGLTGELFKTWIRECLLSTLKEGDIVILDNMSSHKVAGVKELISSVGARIEYLPPYSSDLNPIDLMWSKVKGYLRNASKTEIHELTEAAGEGLKQVTKTDALCWCKHCGYST